ncbi:MAG: hypothetical protein K1X52_13620 [Pyrinomonadaceae bacterium]|nr:hypothetical protein [Pyrinomonadaceae bacterium]
MAKKKPAVATKVTSENRSGKGVGLAFDEILNLRHSYASCNAEGQNLAKEEEEERVEAVLACLRNDASNRPSASEIYANLNLALTTEQIDRERSKAILERLYSRLVTRCEEDDVTPGETEFLDLLLVQARQNVWIEFSSVFDGLSLADQVAELKKIKTTKVLPFNGLYYKAFADLIAWLESGLTSENEQAEKEASLRMQDKKVRAERNLARTTHFLSIIFDELGVRAKTKDQQEVISFLTGYSPNTIKGVLNNPGGKGLTSPPAHKLDVEIVVANFRRLGLSELAEKARRELS